MDTLSFWHQLKTVKAAFAADPSLIELACESPKLAFAAGMPDLALPSELASQFSSLGELLVKSDGPRRKAIVHALMGKVYNEAYDSRDKNQIYRLEEGDGFVVNAAAVVNVVAVINLAITVNAVVHLNVETDSDAQEFKSAFQSIEERLSVAEEFARSPLAAHFRKLKLSPARQAALMDHIFKKNSDCIRCKPSEIIEARYEYRRVPMVIYGRKVGEKIVVESGHC